MNDSIRPGLRHSQSTIEQLEEEGAPRPVCELYALMLEALEGRVAQDRFEHNVRRLASGLRDHATFFQGDLEYLLETRRTRAAGREVGFVLAVTDNADQAVRCVENLNRSGVSDGDIVVVDNASGAGPSGLLSGHPNLQIITNKSRLPRAAAWNQGIGASAATWLVILDPDVVVAPGFKEGLMSFVQGRHRDVVSPTVGEGELDYDISAFSETVRKTMGRAFRRGVACGCLFMVHRRVFQTVGLFDTQPELDGKEADDFFRRARAAGFRLAVTGNAYAHRMNGPAPVATSRAVDTVYYRNKHRLTRSRRFAERTLQSLRSVFWRWIENWRFGMTLRMRRQGGKWRPI